MNFSLPPLSSLFASSLGVVESTAPSESRPNPLEGSGLLQGSVPQVKFGLTSDVFERSPAAQTTDDWDPMAKHPIYYLGEESPDA